MNIRKIFKYGNSQAIRIPKDFQFQNRKIKVFKRGKDIVIRELPKNLAAAYKLLTQFPDDFFAEGRKDTPPQRTKT
jgi:antitoxin VapB